MLPALRLTRRLSRSALRMATLPIKMPALSPTMTKGNIVAWKKAEGEKISVGDVLFEVETDKAVMAMEAADEGYLAKIILGNGASDVPLNKLVALMVEEKGEAPVMPEEKAKPPAPPAPAPAPAAAAQKRPEAAPAPGPTPAPSTAAAKPKDSHKQAATPTNKPLSPAVRALVDKLKLDAAVIPATGPKGWLLKGDVLRFVAGEAPAVKSGGARDKPAADSKPAAAPAAAAVAPASVRKPRRGQPHTDKPATNMRKVIATRLTASKNKVPHAYALASADVTALVELRKKLMGQKFSINDVVVKAAALALRTVPAVNVVNDNGVAKPQSSVDISVAVATPGGLITPIIFNADQRNVAQISTSIAELAGKAREGRLQPHEYQGGTFSISNLGMYGVTHFTAVINPPQACILAVGTTQAVPRLGTTPQQVMRFQLSADEAVVSQDVAAQWLRSFSAFLENPKVLLSDLATTPLEKS